MQLEIRLREILREHGLDKHGVQEEAARFCGTHRHSIRKILDNEASNPSLKLLGKLCDWLVMKLPPAAAADLPARLLGARPAELWRMIASARQARIYIGEYHEISGDPDASPVVVRWLSRRDIEVVGALTRALSTASRTGGHQPVVAMRYVPVRYVPHAELPRRQLQEDIDSSAAIFRQMRREAAGDVSVIIGSQRVSHVTEHLVADLFGCEPFKPIAPGSAPRVPVHLVFRGRERTVPSCFGGLRNPPGRTGRIKPGIYYLDRKDRWVHCPWEYGRIDGGIVITSYQPSTRSLELAVFGFSGRGTEALGRALIKNCEPFWDKKEVDSNDRRVGVYICRFALTEHVLRDRGEVIEAADLHVIPLDPKVLKRYLR